MAVVNGNNTDNTLRGTELNDTMNGLAGDDLMFGYGGDDGMTGGLGNDVMHSGGGNDLLYGEAGDDRLILTGTGNKVVHGGEGFDRVEIDLTHLGAGVNVTTQFSFHIGTPVNYRIAASDDSTSALLNTFEQLYVRSGAGDDRLHGTKSHDVIRGGAGNDTLGDFRFGGNDWFYGGAGDDFLYGGTRNVRLFGGSGNDDLTVRYASGAGVKSELSGGTGTDRLNITLGGTDDQRFTFSSGDRTVQEDGLVIDTLETLGLQTGSGNDRLDLTVKAAGNYSWHASLGHDYATLDLSQITGQAQFGYRGTQGSGQWMSNGEQVTIGLYEIEGLEITGNAQANTFRGGDFRNTFYGGGGSDTLTGGSSVDLLYGQSGADSLGGDAGNDFLFGGAGHDTLGGGADDDVLYGGAGHDTLYGDLDGGVSGDDQLFGGGGRDRLFGGGGSDELTGGGGRDHFVFRKGDGTDQILDFQLGKDKIDLRQTRFGSDDMVLTQHSGFVEVTFDGDDSADGTTIQVLNLTLAQLDDGSNFLF